MANPQKENGYTAIANELLDEIIRGSFTATQYKIILLILRYSYGFNRKSCGLSVSFVRSAIDGNERYVRRELQRLIDGNVICVDSEPTFSKPRELSFNKNYETWAVSFRQQRADTTRGGVQAHTRGGVEVHTRGGVQTPQENNNKTKLKQELCEFFETVWKLYPEKKGKAHVSEKSKKALLNLGVDTVVRCINRYIADKPDWQQYQNGSTFFNGGYIDYLDENYEKRMEAKARSPDPYEGYKHF